MMSKAERSAFYLWFTWRRATPASYSGGVLTRCKPDDPAKDRCWFYKTDSEEVADDLCAMLQETEGESPRFGFTPAKDLDIRQTVLADDAIGKYADGGYDDKGQTFFFQAWRLENLLRQKLGLRPMESLREAEQAGATPKEPKAEADWHDVQARLIRLYEVGEAYTSQRELAKRMKCSKSTMNKAFNASGKLKSWMERRDMASPKAQSLNEVVTDTTVSRQEDNPADRPLDDEVDQIMGQLIEQAKPDERAKLNELNNEGRRKMAKLYLEQQGDQHIEDKATKGNRILGRKL